MGTGPGWFTWMVVLAVTSLAMISMMFLLMVRVSDPLVPRAIFGVLNTQLLFFPSGAVQRRRRATARLELLRRMLG